MVYTSSNSNFDGSGSCRNPPETPIDVNAKTLFKHRDCDPSEYSQDSIIFKRFKEEDCNRGTIYFPLVQHQPFASVGKRSASYNEYE